MISAPSGLGSRILQAAQEVPDTAREAAAPLTDPDVLLTSEGLAPLARALLVLALGLPVLFLLSRWLRRWVTGVGSRQWGMVAGKLSFYLGVGILGVWFLDELGFGMAPLLGAAGILGIALGFASQTSVSNIISGFFLMAEQPFVVDDLVQVGTTIGRVESIDMLSVKLRTFDNRFVRIPNESIIKTEVTNITRYPIRRLDVAVGVAYKEDVEQVRRVLLEVAEANPIALLDPAPVVLFDGYGESSLNFSFRVWTARENFLELKNTIHEEVKGRFDEEGIEIPFPHRTLYTGAVTEPFPVRLVHGAAPAPELAPNATDATRAADGTPDGTEAAPDATDAARDGDSA